MAMPCIQIYVCDHLGRQGTTQPSGPHIHARTEGPPSLPETYADFRVLHDVWRDPAEYPEFVGFFGYRKYICGQHLGQKMLGAPADLIFRPGHAPGWWDCDLHTFDIYRNFLAEWDFAEMLPMLAAHDIIVTPPFPIGDNMFVDFAKSRSNEDADTLAKALFRRGLTMDSHKIYPYIFITRWSVFNRFMEWAQILIDEIDPLIQARGSADAAYKRRPMAYVLERAFSTWLEASGLDLKELPILSCWDA